MTAEERRPRGYKPLERKIKVSGGEVRINAELEKNTDSPNARNDPPKKIAY